MTQDTNIARIQMLTCVMKSSVIREANEFQVTCYGISSRRIYFSSNKMRTVHVRYKLFQTFLITRSEFRLLTSLSLFSAQRDHKVSKKMDPNKGNLDNWNVNITCFYYFPYITRKGNQGAQLYTHKRSELYREARCSKSIHMKSGKHVPKKIKQCFYFFHCERRRIKRED